jgi:hypothetical protein
VRKVRRKCERKKGECGKKRPMESKIDKINVEEGKTQLKKVDEN